MINGTNVMWKSKNLVTADFTIPSTATIGADWSVFVQHNDDGKSSTRTASLLRGRQGQTSVPHVIWQHAPWFTTSVQIYSETGFDATTVNPYVGQPGRRTAVLEYQLKDMNRDGKKDLQLRLLQRVRNYPCRFQVGPVAVAARTNSWVPIKGFDTV